MVATIDQVKLDHGGMEQVLKSSDVADAIGAIAHKIGDNVSDHVDGAEVVVDEYTTDRAAASVTVKDVRGMAWEVRDGLLSRAAGAQGLEVNTHG